MALKVCVQSFRAPGWYADLTYCVSSDYSFWGYLISPGILILPSQTETVQRHLYHVGYGGLALFVNKNE